MTMIADILLGAGALGAAVYCLVLSRRLRQLTQLDSGMGGAIAVLSAQVDDMTRTLGRAQDAARDSASSLDSQTRRAEAAVERIEILLATLHDLPEPGKAAPGGKRADAPPAPRRRVVRQRKKVDPPESGGATWTGQAEPERSRDAALAANEPQTEAAQ